MRNLQSLMLPISDNKNSRYVFTFKQKFWFGCLVILFSLTIKAQSGSSCQNAININSMNNQRMSINNPVPNKWFYFTASSTNENILVIGENDKQTKINKLIIYGGTCSNLTTLYSHTFTPADSQRVYKNFQNLIPNSQYYVEVEYASPNTAAINIEISVIDATACPASGCSIINESFDNASVPSGDTDDPFFQNDVACWGQAWGTPQIKNFAGSQVAFMASEYTNGSTTCGNNAFNSTINANQGESIFRNFPTNLSSQKIYILEYDYAPSNGNGLEQLDVILTSNFTAVFSTIIPSLSGTDQIDQLVNIPSSGSLTHRSICFTVPNNSYSQIVFYPQTTTKTGVCVLQGAFIDNVKLFEIDPTTSNSTITCGQTTQLGTNCNIPNINYSWSPTAGLSNPTIPNPVASPTTTTNYVLTISLMSGSTVLCSSANTVNIVVNGPVCPTFANSLCAGQTNTLSIANPDPNVTYSWLPQVTNAPGNTNGSVVIITNPVAGSVYTVSAVYTNCLGNTSSKTTGTPTCCTCESTITVKPAAPIPTVTSTGTSICPGKSVTLTMTDPLQPSFPFGWYQSSPPSLNCTNNCLTTTASPLTTTTYTAFISYNGCTGTQMITINVIPDPVITISAGPTASFCSGNPQNITLTANGAATYTWAINPVSHANPIIVYPTTTQVYNVSGTNSSGCTSSGSITITENPSPAISINDNPVPVICTQDPGSSVQLSAVSSVNNYNWTPVTGLNNSNAYNPTASPAITTLYTLSSTDPITGCSAQDTVTVFVENCSCGGRANHPYNGTTISNPNQVSSTIVSFNNDVTIIQSMTLTNKTFIFGPNVKMIVQAPNTLTLSHDHLYACLDMWQGIVVQPGASLVVQDSSMIEDAFEAINCTNWNTTSGNKLTVDGCVFNRNETAIKIVNFPYNTNFPDSIKNAVFTSRTLPFTNSGVYGWSTPATPQNVKSIVAVSNVLQTPYKLAHVAAYTPQKMKAPNQNDYSVYGVYLSNVGLGNTNGTAILPASYSDITIGSTKNVINNGSLNLFDGLYYGIYANTSNFTCRNNAFELLQYITCRKCTYPNMGTAIYAANTSLSSTSQVYTRGRVIYPGYAPATNPNTNNSNYYAPPYNNKFYDCVRAVNSINYTELHVAGTDIRSMQSKLNIQPNSALNTVGLYGILAGSSTYKYNYFRYNLITNINTGISFTAGNINGAQSLGLVSADYNNITAYFNASPGTQFVSNAVAIDNSINCYSAPASCQRNVYYNISANRNNIQNVYSGIELMNWIGGHGVRKITYNISADTNYISLVQNSFNATATQFGINANHCYGHDISNNNIYGNTAVLANNTNIRGIYPKDNAQSTVQCNSTTNVGRGFDFEGQNPGTFNYNDAATWAYNTMNNNGQGFRLSNACILGQQGDVLSASDNQWTGTWSGTNFGTYVDAASNAANSPLYVQSTSPYYPPNCGYIIQAKSYCSSFGNVISGSAVSGNICGTLPQAPCTRCPINGRQIAEQVVQDSLDFPLLAAENSYKAQLKYFKLIAMNDSLADSSAVLQSFFTSNQNTNLGKITAIESNLAQGNITAAKSLNMALTPANVIESNYQKFYTSAINVADTVYSVTDSLTLITLANSCPATNGDVVYSARALYNAVNNQYRYFEDNCHYDSLFQTTSARLSKKKNTVFGSITNVNNSLLVYPNPSSGDIFISSSALNDKEWGIEITDITGRTVIQNSYTINNGLVKLNTQLTNGIYFVKVIANGMVKQQKVIITR